MERRKDYSFGIILILIGITLMVLKMDLGIDGIVLGAVGIAFLISYYFKRNTGYLIAGMFCFLMGVTSALDSYRLISIDISGFIFMAGLGVIFLILYFVKGIYGFVYPGCILLAMGTYTLLEEIYTVDISWAFFTAIGIAFYLIYLIDTRKRNTKWPLIPGTILILFSGVLFLNAENIISRDFWQIIGYAWPLILIFGGVKIIYNNTISK